MKKMNCRDRFLIAAALALLPASAFAANSYSVCIDPGHGGTDPGAVAKASYGCDIDSLATSAGNLEEADVVLDIGKRLRTYLKNAGFSAVYMTRDTDTFPSLSDRTSYANSKNCTRFVSIHNNSSAAATGNGPTGTETYCYSGNSLTSKGCVQAQNIQNEMQKVWPIKNRGRKQASFYVIKNTNMPATLSEVAFINNCDPDVNDYLSVASQRDRAAKAHLFALQTSLGLTQGTGSSGGSSGGSTGGSSSGGTSGGNSGGTSGGSTGGSSSGGTSGGNSGGTSGGSTGGSSSGGTQTVTYGAARGVLFEDVGLGTLDMSKRIASGTVSVNGQNVTTDKNGNWKFSKLAVGTQAIWGSADGYKSASKYCKVTEGTETWCSFGLKPLTASEPAKTGTLHGIVYQDGNYDNRVTPAQVKLNATGKIVNWRGGGDWSFEELTPGTYTVTVSATGYEEKVYLCPNPVTAGGAAVCNVELEVDRTEGGGSSIYDGGDSGSGSGSGSTVTDPQNGGNNSGDDPSGWWNNESGWWDSDDIESAEIDDEESNLNQSNQNAGGSSSPSTLPNNDTVSGITSISSQGCSSTGSAESAGTGFLALLGAAGILFFRRRRSAARSTLTALMGLAVFGIAGTAFADAGSSAQALPVKKAVKTAKAFAVASDIHTLIEGDSYKAPIISPDGRKIAFTRFGMDKLMLRDMDGGAIQTISEDVNSGNAPVFSRDSETIAFREPGQSISAVPSRLAHVRQLRSSVAPKAFKLHKNLIVYQTEEDAIILRQGNNEKIVAASPREKFYRPFLTADGAWVIYSGLKTGGIYGYRVADGMTVRLGPGNYASGSEDGRWLVFSRTWDNGHEVTTANLHIVDLSAKIPKVCEVPMNSEIVLEPNFNAGTSTLVFTDGEGTIKAAKLEVH